MGGGPHRVENSVQSGRNAPHKRVDWRQDRPKIRQRDAEERGPVGARNEGRNDRL